MNFKLSLFGKELLLYGMAMAVGLFVAYHYGSYTPDAIIVEPLQFTWQNVSIIMGSFLFFSFVLAKFRRIAGFSFKFFLFLVVISGSQLFFASFIQSPWDLIAAVAVGLVMLAARMIITHNIGTILGIAGVSALLGLSITPIAALIIISALSIYDIISVYKTRHMVRLAENMLASGAVFGFLIPLRYRDFFMRIENNNFRERCMILGSGDVGLPIMFAASMVAGSLSSALVVAGFSAVGLFVTHLLFVNQGQRQAMAALPPIATASILGYFLAIFL